MTAGCKLPDDVKFNILHCEFLDAVIPARGNNKELPCIRLEKQHVELKRSYDKLQEKYTEVLEKTSNGLDILEFENSTEAELKTLAATQAKRIKELETFAYWINYCCEGELICSGCHYYDEDADTCNSFKTFKKLGIKNPDEQ